MGTVVHEIVKVVYSMYIFLKMLRLQENMTVYIWQGKVKSKCEKN